MPPVLYPLPPCEYSSGDGYDHCPYTANRHDRQWIAITSSDTWLAGMLRLLTGYKLYRGEWVTSRGPTSFISLDGSSLGIAHHHSGTIPSWLSAMVDLCFPQASWAWGATTAESMRSESWIRANVPDVRGDMRHPESLDWLLSGWWEISGEPGWIAAQIYEWAQNYVIDGADICREMGWSSARALAAVTRMVNSRGDSGARSILDRARAQSISQTADAILRFAYTQPKSDGGYGHPDRWEKLVSWPEFRGQAPNVLQIFEQLNLNAPVIRPDGTRPIWAQRGYSFPKPTLPPIFLALSPHDENASLHKKKAQSLVPIPLQMAGAFLLGRWILRR